MSIAFLLQAAEFLERRERGKIGTFITLEIIFVRIFECLIYTLKTADRLLCMALMYFSESEHGYASPMPIPEDHADLVRRHRIVKPTHHKRSTVVPGIR